jgi:succinyl-CoA synthetase alpha subunit
MSILLNKGTRVLVQGITGKIGQTQTKWMKEYGTNIVAGVTPGRGGASVEGVPVFDAVAEAVKATGAEASVFFVPARGVKDTVFETLEAGIKLLVVITEHVPVHDTMEMRAEARKMGATLLGPTTPGILTVGEAKMGIIPGNLFPKVGGRAGVISRSGTLAYEVGGILSKAGTTPSTVVGMGADPVVLTDLADLLKLFAADPGTDFVTIVGEVGGIQEEMAAEYIAQEFRKPVIAYIAGRNTPEGKRMGHAGAIVQRGMGSVTSKVAALEKAGAHIANTPAEIGEIARRLAAHASSD